MPYIDCTLHDPPERIENPTPLGLALEVIDHMVAHCRTPLTELPPDVLSDLNLNVDIDVGAGIGKSGPGNG